MIQRVLAECYFIIGKYLEDRFLPEAGDRFLRIHNYEKALKAFELCRQRFTEERKMRGRNYNEAEMLIDSLGGGLKRCLAIGKALADIGATDKALEYIEAIISVASHYRTPPTEPRDKIGLEAAEVRLKCNPDSSEFFFWKIHFLSNLRLYDELVNQCDVFLDKFPKCFRSNDVWYYKGIGLMASRSYAEALRCMDKFMDLAGGINVMPSYWANRAIILQQLDNEKEAQDCKEEERKAMERLSNAYR
jgi:tetratricopeptide (TPR) repeat protein